MNNEQYLILLYIIIGTLCVLLGLAAYGLLRRSFNSLSNAIFGGRLGILFRKVFSIGLILPALAGFFSVSFRSCSKQSYEAIVEDKSYLIAKGQEQLGTSMMYIAIALLVWALLVSIGLVTLGKKTKEGG